MPSASENHILCGRIEHGAAADCFAESFAEMTEAGVADFDRRFSDVIPSASQKLGGAFHPNIAEILRDGETDFARKNPA